MQNMEENLKLTPLQAEKKERDEQIRKEYQRLTTGENKDNSKMMVVKYIANKYKLASLTSVYNITREIRK